MANIGLIDVDGHNFPNIPLMKISAWHKKNGDNVDFYNPFYLDYDKVYMSKIFTFTKDYEHCVNAKEVVRGGTGYFYPDGGETLPEEVEHIYPDYDLYGIKDTAYGFLTRGCPRGCDFCIVGKKEGRKSAKVADLEEFWRGQKKIVLCDPNLFACKEWRDLTEQLIDSRANVNINQGADVRILSGEMIEQIRKIKMDSIHFAWDRFEHKDIVVPQLKLFKDITRWGRNKVIVYVLCNFDTTFEQDLERIYTIRDIGFSPYVSSTKSGMRKKSIEISKGGATTDLFLTRARTSMITSVDSLE